MPPHSASAAPHRKLDTTNNVYKARQQAREALAISNHDEQVALAVAASLGVDKLQQRLLLDAPLHERALGSPSLETAAHFARRVDDFSSSGSHVVAHRNAPHVGVWELALPSPGALGSYGASPLAIGLRRVFNIPDQCQNGSQLVSLLRL